MKKFLTVLLALSVVFTYSFSAVGTAFAAVPNADDAKTALGEQVADSCKEIDAAADKLVNKTFSYVDGYLVSAGDANKLGTDNKAKGLVPKAVIEKKVAELVKTAKTSVTAAVNAQYESGGPLVDPGTDADYTQDQINTAVLNVKNAGIAAANDIDAEAVLGELAGSDAYPMTIIDADLVASFEDTATKAIEAYNPSNYSDKAEDVMDVKADPVVGVADEIVNSLTGASGLTEDEHTYRTVVKGILETQAGKIAEAKSALEAVGASPAASDFITAIKAYKKAAKTAKDYIEGHKRTATEDYFIEAIPTIDDLDKDTTVESRKSTAVKKVEAALAAKALDIELGLKDDLDKFNEHSSLTTAQQKDKANLEAAIAALDEQIAAAKKVYVERINYKKTITNVEAVEANILGAIAAFKTKWEEFKADGGAADKTEEILGGFVDTLDAIEAVKAEAALTAEMKDVNGQPYVDAEQLAELLAEAIEGLYDGSLNKDDAIKKVQGTSKEADLIAKKIDYINFIYGDNNHGNFTPLDENGKKVTEAWKKSDATRAAENKTVMNGLEVEKDTANTVAVYDDAQAAELAKLVEDTEAAIEGAKVLSEVKKIFTEAHAKYEDIVTTADHIDAWDTAGDLYKAYTKANFEQEIDAYAKFVVAKVDTTKYTGLNEGAVKTAMKKIVFTAYKVDELDAKLAEAKAMADKILTTKQLQEQAAAVDALIAAIGTPVTLADKDAIVAAADAKAAYLELFGADENDIANRAILTAAITTYEKLAADEIDDAYDELKKATITTADADAIKALRAAYDAHMDFVDEYNAGVETVTPEDADIEGLEKKLGEAQLKAVKDLLVKLPANPTSKDKAQVEAARAAYDALTLAQKQELVGTIYYQNLIDAEESLITSRIDAVNAFKIKVTTQRYTGKKMVVKWTTVGDESAIDGYRIYFSTKKTNSGYKYLAKTSKKYINHTSIKKNVKKGTRVYYRVRAYVEIDGQRYFSDYSTVGNRIWK